MDPTATAGSARADEIKRTKLTNYTSEKNAFDQAGNNCNISNAEVSPPLYGICQTSKVLK